MGVDNTNEGGGGLLWYCVSIEHIQNDFINIKYYKGKNKERKNNIQNEHKEVDEDDGDHNPTKIFIEDSGSGDLDGVVNLYFLSLVTVFIEQAIVAMDIPWKLPNPVVRNHTSVYLDMYNYGDIPTLWIIMDKHYTRDVLSAYKLVTNTQKIKGSLCINTHSGIVVTKIVYGEFI